MDGGGEGAQGVQNVILQEARRRQEKEREKEWEDNVLFQNGQSGTQGTCNTTPATRTSTVLYWGNRENTDAEQERERTRNDGSGRKEERRGG